MATTWFVEDLSEECKQTFKGKRKFFYFGARSIKWGQNLNDSCSLANILDEMAQNYDQWKKKNPELAEKYESEWKAKDPRR